MNVQPAAQSAGITEGARSAEVTAWAGLRTLAAREAPWLRTPRPAGPGCCAVCRGPAQASYLRCFQCAQHRQRARGLLADVVVPVSYAVSGTRYARTLWQYKSDTQGRDAARAALRALLLVFLRDHGRCVWTASGGPPTHLAVVPSGRGRAGEHPLRALAAPYLTLPWAGLAVCPAEPVLARDLNPWWFRAAGPLTGARVLLLDDTWTSGSSAQSAAVALKLAGAMTVAVVTLARHLNPGQQREIACAAVLRDSSFRPDRCAVHVMKNSPRIILKTGSTRVLAAQMTTTRV
jgi:hypothetical protein